MPFTGPASHATLVRAKGKPGIPSGIPVRRKNGSRADLGSLNKPAKKTFKNSEKIERPGIGANPLRHACSWLPLLGNSDKADFIYPFQPIFSKLRSIYNFFFKDLLMDCRCGKRPYKLNMIVGLKKLIRSDNVSPEQVEALGAFSRCM